MTTIINNPNQEGKSDSEGGLGVIVGAVLVILILVIVIILSLPYIKQQINIITHPSKPVINIQLPNLPVNNNASTTK